MLIEENPKVAAGSSPIRLIAARKKCLKRCNDGGVELTFGGLG